jgi:hypothetical protein
MDLSDKERSSTRRGGVTFIWIREKFLGYIAVVVTDLWRL